MMITRTQRAVGLAAALTVGAAACNNDALTNVNNNPNGATTAPAPALFTNAVRNGVTRWLGTGYDLRATEFVAQHMAEVQYPQDDNYARLAGGFTATFFDNAYAGEQEDLQKVVQSGTASSNPYIYAPALVMRTWGYGYLTDSWGDIPYFQALAGDSTGGTLSPMYDKQKDIYADFFKVLAKASADLAAAPATGLVTLGSADPIYSGSRAKYEKFANSLRLRFAMRLSAADPATAQAQIVAALAAPGGVFTSNADNAVFKWPGDGVYDNPWAVNFKTRDDNRLSNRLVDNMAPYGDPRLPVYGMPVTGTNNYVGLDNALSQDSAGTFLSTTSRPGAIFYPGTTTYGTFGGAGATTPSYLMTYAEVLFIQAEAAERGWIPGSAAAFYNQAIQASMAQWGVTDATAIANYLANTNIVYKPGAAGLAQIATQKWIALYTDGGQAWAEYRRTCQPAQIHAGPQAITSAVIRRFQYSTTETAVNGEGIKAAVADQGPDDFMTHVYWDKSPNCGPRS